MSLQNPQRAYAWKTKQVVDDRNPPTLNTAHSVFSETGGVKLHSIVIRQENTPTIAAEIDIIIIKDGTTYETNPAIIGNLADSTDYSVFMHQDGPSATAAYEMDILAITTAGHQKSVMAKYVSNANIEGISEEPICGHAIEVQIRQDSAIQVGARIRTECTYEVLEAL